MPHLRKYREAVDRLVDEGATMPEIESVVFRPQLPEEQGAALWLYAHALASRPRPDQTEPPSRPHLVVQL